MQQLKYKIKYKMRIKDLLQKDELSALTPAQNLAVFGKHDTMLCVDAKHFRPYDYDDWVECGELEDVQYTWYIPYTVGRWVKPGDLLVVENTVGHGVSIVVAVSTAYKVSRDHLRNSGHPYCGVIAKLGAVELANGKTTHEIELG